MADRSQQDNNHEPVVDDQDSIEATLNRDFPVHERFDDGDDSDESIMRFLIHGHHEHEHQEQSSSDHIPDGECAADGSDNESWETMSSSDFSESQLPDADLNKWIQKLQKALPLATDVSNKSWLLHQLVTLLHTRFERHGDNSDLHECVKKQQEGVQITPDNNPDKLTFLNNLATLLELRFETLGDLNDLKQSIQILEQAIHLVPDDHDEISEWLTSIGNSLGTLFEKSADINDLNMSIRRLQKAVELTPDDDTAKLERLTNLAESLSIRFYKIGNLDDMKESVQRLQQAVQLIPDGHPDKASYLSELGSSLHAIFTSNGDSNALSLLIAKSEEALQLTLDDDPERPERLSNLGVSLRARFTRNGDVDDLNMSIEKLQEALRLAPVAHSTQATLLSHLANSLEDRFIRHGNISDLHEAVKMQHEAVQLTPDNHPNKPAMLSNLGSSVHTRFDIYGDLDDLDLLVQSKLQASHLTRDGDANKSSKLHGVGIAHQIRYDRHGDVGDLKLALENNHQAVNMVHDGHPDKPARLSSLGTSLRASFERFENLEDLKESVKRQREAVNATPDSHSDKPLYLGNLGNTLDISFERLDDLSDLDLAIQTKREAVKLTPNEHTEKPTRLSNLATSLRRRYERLGNLSDFTESSALFQEALQLTTANHFDHTIFMRRLGGLLHSRFRKERDSQHATQAIEYLSCAARSLTGQPSVKFHAAVEWANLANAIQDASLLDGYKMAVHLLPQLAWLGSSVQERHFQLKGAHAFLKHAVESAIQSGEAGLAAEWLEQGRSIVWGQLLQLRTPLDNLKQLHPELGLKLENLSFILENSTRGLQSTAQTHSSLNLLYDRHQTAHQREDIIKQIHQLPGFETFLLPRPLSVLTKSATLGYVILLNASPKQCNALVLVSGLCNNVVHIPLAQVTQKDLKDWWHIIRNVVQDQLPLKGATNDHAKRLGIQTQKTILTSTVEKAFKVVLKLIWERIMKPIVKKLALTTHNLRRIWWCPTDTFSFLPLHAAGDYSPNTPFGSKLSDYAISSYTPSVTALIEALSSSELEKKLSTSPSQLLVVLQPQELPATNRELELIKTQALNAVSVQALVGSEATVEHVKEEMQKADWVHFACHGVQNSNAPLDSALIVAGGSKLTLSEIMTMKLPHKGLAFLSACQTATGDAELTEEAIHLAAGMLSSGYKSVIATMWSINDQHAPDIANHIYEYLFKNGKADNYQVAEALHYAVEKLQKDKKTSLAAWVPFIHVGL